MSFLQAVEATDGRWIGKQTLPSECPSAGLAQAEPPLGETEQRRVDVRQLSLRTVG
jgi:hypothetical protein